MCVCVCVIDLLTEAKSGAAALAVEQRSAAAAVSVHSGATALGPGAAQVSSGASTTRAPPAGCPLLYHAGPGGGTPARA